MANMPYQKPRIAHLIALNRSAEVLERLRSLIEVVENQPPDFKVQRSFAGLEHFIDANQRFTANKAGLLELFAGMNGENRGVIAKKLGFVGLKN